MKDNKAVIAKRAGVRFFECDVCGHEWHEASRDALSPSGEACERCLEHISPVSHVLVDGVTMSATGGIDRAEVLKKYAEQTGETLD